MSPLAQARAAARAAAIRLADDPAVRWLALARAAQALAGPVLLWLALTRLSDAGRAFYAIVINLAFLGTVVEVGPGTLLVQLAAHHGGCPTPALMRRARRWFATLALGWVAVATLVLAPPLAARAAGLDESFAAGWGILVVLVALHIALVPAVAWREGGGRTVAVQRMRLWQATGGALAAAGALWLGRPLLAGAAAAALFLGAVGVLVAVHPIAEAAPGRASETAADANYPAAQRRSALTWLALWAAPQALVPVAVLVAGADAAGPLGVGMALALAPAAFAVAWLHGRYATFGALVADGRLREFDRATADAMRRALLVYAAAALAVLLFPWAAELVRPGLRARLLAAPLLAALLAAHVALLMLQGMLAWARAFGEEPFAGATALGCAAMVVAAVVGMRTAGIGGSVIGYALASAAALLLVAHPFRRLRAGRLADHHEPRR